MCWCSFWCTVLTNKATKLTLIRINSKSSLYFKTAQTRKHITVNTIDALTVQKGIRRHTADLCKENTAKNVKDTQDGGQTLLLGQYIWCYLSFFIDLWLQLVFSLTTRICSDFSVEARRSSRSDIVRTTVQCTVYTIPEIIWIYRVNESIICSKQSCFVESLVWTSASKFLHLNSE